KPMVYIMASAGGGGRGGRGRGGPGGGGGGQESWNWASNAMVTVRCYTTCPEVVLVLNDTPIGTNRLAEAAQGTLTWQVPFQPGVLKAVGRSNGVAQCEYTLKTAGPAARIELLPDVKEL